MFYVPFCDGLTSITLIVLTIEQQIKVCVRQISDNTWKSCYYYSIQVYDNSNMVFFENSWGQWPHYAQYILFCNHGGKLYTIEINAEFQDQVPYTYSKCTCLNEDTKKSLKIRNQSDKQCLKISQRYFKDCTASREQENSNVL